MSADLAARRTAAALTGCQREARTAVLAGRAGRGARPPAIAAQAELHTRRLPAAADLMAAEARGCQHARTARTGAVR